MSEEDSELIARCKNGDQDAFYELYDRYIKYAYGTALLLVKNTAVASDICQDAFIKVYENLHRFKDGSPFRPWFYRILVNEAMRLTRRIMRWPVPVEKVPENLQISPDSPETVIVSREQAVEIWQAVNKLPAKLKIPVVLRYYVELSEEEVAQAMQIPTGTVKSRLSRGRERLRQLLSENILLTGGMNHA